MVQMLLEADRDGALSALCHSAHPAHPQQEALLTACAHGLHVLVRELVRLGADVPGHVHPVRASAA